MILVDADVWIDYLAGVDPGATSVERLLIERRALLSAVTVFELFAGITGKKRFEHLSKLVENLPTVPLSPLAARMAAEFYTRLKKRGKLIGNQDLMLAATAAELEIPVLTRNKKHFDQIPEISVLGPDEVLS